MNLYFARLELGGNIVAGGHFLGVDASDARQEALKAFSRDVQTASKCGFDLAFRTVEACTLTVKRSKASRSNAMNEVRT